MKKFIAYMLFLLVFSLICLPGCLLEEKVLDIVLTEETCADFTELHLIASFSTPAIVDLGQAVDDILLENGVSRSDIKLAKLVSVSYGVTEFALPHHDWLISGAISIERQDISSGPVNILTYTNQSITGALDTMITADLTPAGVDLLNTALDDFTNNQNPVLVFTVQNGSVSPGPSAQDPIEFKWKACAVMHVVVEQSLDVPDPF